jgi:putative MFS transporter
MAQSKIENGVGVSQIEGEIDGREGIHAAELIARIESVPFSRWHTKVRVIMGSATFFDAFNALSLAFALPVLIRLWHISASQIGVLISASYIGQLIGALFFSWLAEKIGRVPGATASVAIMAIMNFGCVLSGSFPALFVCRFVQGIGVGGEMPVAAAYISELSKAHGRGKFFMLYELIFPIGLMTTGQVGAWLVPALGWKALFLVGGIPGLLITFLTYRLPESPRWLISKGRLAEAETIVRQIEASTERRVSVTPKPETKATADTNSVSKNSIAAVDHRQRSSWTETLSGFYRGRTLVVWVLWASAYFVANSLNNWLPTLYNTVYRLGLQQSLRAASMTNVTQVIILLACAFCIDRIGRRNWVIAGFVLGAMVLAALGFMGARNVMSVMIWGTLSYGIIGSICAVLYLYTPEVYPTRMRAIGTGLASSWLRLASAVGPALVGVMVGAEGIASVFLMFAAVSVVGAVAALFMIETHDRRLEEIAP